jgi:hypothetical protein
MQPQHIDHKPSVASFAGMLSAMTAAKETAESVTHSPAQNSEAVSSRENAVCSQGKRNGKRKRASVTVRMSREEFIQLRARSVEANLTMSAYLRSCTFEAESLRAQVKQALAELRNLPAISPQPESAVPKWLRLLRR